MKKALSYVALILCCCSLGATAWWSSRTIKWEHKTKPLFEFKYENTTVQLGLVSDGTVVWREITNTTNSPVENIESQVFGYTNIWSTNYLYLTNHYYIHEN